MKTPALFLLLPLLLSSPLTCNAQLAATYSITGVAPGDTLNVRAGPGSSFQSISRLAGNAKVRITGEARMNGEDKWVEILSESNRRGWVNAKFLRRTDDAGAAEIQLTAADRAVWRTYLESSPFRNINQNYERSVEVADQAARSMTQPDLRNHLIAVRDSLSAFQQKLKEAQKVQTIMRANIAAGRKLGENIAPDILTEAIGEPQPGMNEDFVGAVGQLLERYYNARADGAVVLFMLAPGLERQHRLALAERSFAAETKGASWGSYDEFIRKSEKCANDLKKIRAALRQ